MPENPEEQAARSIAQRHGLEYVAPRLIDTRRDWATLVPEGIARAYNVLPQGTRGAAVRVLVSDPLDFATIDMLRFHAGRSIELVVSSDKAIREAIDRLYGTSGL